MSGQFVNLAVGASTLFDGDPVRIVELDGRAVTVQGADGGYRQVELGEFVSRARGQDVADADADPGIVLTGLSAAERERVMQRAAHVREVLTGYRSGYAGSAAPGEPRECFAEGVPLKRRYATKAAELSVTARTVESWAAAYRRGGEAALVDDRSRRGLRTSVDPRWDTAVRAELAAGVAASTPTRSAVLTRVAARLEREHGPGVVPVPPRTTAYRRLAQLVKGTNAVSGSAQARRSIADRPSGVYGRLRATRPGEYLISDTQDLDVFAMEPVTCRWVRAQLTVAQDLFDRQIVGLKVTPVSTKAVDVAGVLFEAVTGRTAGPRLADPHGVPERLVFAELDSESAGSAGWCPPETLVVDHGKAFLSAQVIGACARLGISIQPAQPHKPTDKPTVERFFKSLREGLIQHLPAYTGPDLHSRGTGLTEQAFLFLHELEDLIRDWIVNIYHRSDHDGLAVAEWPRLALCPNEMFTLGVAKAGLLRLPVTPELPFAFLRVSWRTIQHYGVEVDGLRYNGPALDGHRNQRSPYGGVTAGKWPIRVDDDDVRAVFFQEPSDGSWHRLDWEHAPLLRTPFSAEAAKHARTLAARADQPLDPAEAMRELLQRWSSGE
ncbi:MAG: Mu transposase C-terminal domain-containing protein, partial [Actinomycetia bacterium]|nr:Mu transposase C-terminal domain-containing protein [Actinomycetes bacterium]